MHLYLLRHGIAENGKPGSPDIDRALVAEGRKRLREVLRVAKGAGMSPRLILTSPYQRAVESAEIAAAVLGYKAELLRTSALTPDSMPQKAYDEVRVHGDAEQLLLVGHEPLFSQLTAYLLASPGMPVEFQKGAIMRLDLDQLGPQPRGVLRWYLTAKLAKAVRE
ncbi:MAG: histidine phosphatase family protein [Acidobacteriia bacterium]|nr:histidine phosphatase family protein [Terriglobia bacterium]